MTVEPSYQSHNRSVGEYSTGPFRQDLPSRPRHVQMGNAYFFDMSPDRHADTPVHYGQYSQAGNDSTSHYVTSRRQTEPDGETSLDRSYSYPSQDRFKIPGPRQNSRFPYAEHSIVPTLYSSSSSVRRSPDTPVRESGNFGHPGSNRQAEEPARGDPYRSHTDHHGNDLYDSDDLDQRYPPSRSSQRLDNYRTSQIPDESDSASPAHYRDNRFNNQPASPHVHFKRGTRDNRASYNIESGEIDRWTRRSENLTSEDEIWSGGFGRRSNRDPYQSRGVNETTLPLRTATRTDRSEPYAREASRESPYPEERRPNASRAPDFGGRSFTNARTASPDSILADDSERSRSRSRSNSQSRSRSKSSDAYKTPVTWSRTLNCLSLTHINSEREVSTCT